MRLAAACLLFILFAVTSPASLAHDAESTLDKIARTGEFVIGFRADASPLSYLNADGQPSGYSVDLCRRIASAINDHFSDQEIETIYRRIDADDRIAAVVEGRIDIECGSTTITLSRQEQVDFTLPTFVTGGSVLSLTKTGIQSMADLAGKRVGVAKGTTTVEEVKLLLEQDAIDAELVIVENRDIGMQMLNRGGIDALASDQIVLIGQIIEAVDPKRYSLVSEVFSYEPYGLVVRRNDADFRLLVNRALSRLYASGEHADIFYKWIGRIGITLPPILGAMYQLSTIPE